MNQNRININYKDLQNDPDYLLMLKEYQQANWEECTHLLSVLMEKYPNNPKLEEFKQDFDFQYSIHKNAKKNALSKNRKNFLNASKKTLLTILIIVGVIVIGWGGYMLMAKNALLDQTEYRGNQVQLLGSQIDALLLAGQPDKAFELIDKMKAIDPQNPLVADYTSKADKIRTFETMYEDAQAKISAGMDVEALTIFQSIENQNPGFRDVEQQISATKTRIEISLAMAEATKAYDESRWGDAIAGFERIQTLDPNAVDSNIKEMLLNSYLRRIIQMLESDTTTIGDIDQAEIYYRRAISMIPQSRIFQSERENLQKISSSLLEMKYTQTAYALIEDPNQTQVTVNQAVNYLKKASNLNPSNSILQTQLDKINLYQIGFSDYLEMNWPAAIDNLQKLVNLDDSFANGYAKQLLYESHMGRGASYYSVGLYLDARLEYEAAENLVWDQNNLMTLFMTEVELGKTLGKIKDYKDAASYFKYTFETVNYVSRASAQPGFVTSAAAAIQFFNNNQFQESYEAFLAILPDIGFLFTEKEINAQIGTCLALVAAQNNSSVQAIVERNNLSRQTLITSDQQLIIPMMIKQ